MAKTKSIEVTCSEAIISPNTYNLVSVNLSHPDVDSLLENMEKDDLTAYVRDALEPEDIFSETILEKWAEANGYVKQADNE
jgi:hypothetical protein